jgi:hypothetical protein
MTIKKINSFVDFCEYGGMHFFLNVEIFIEKPLRLWSFTDCSSTDRNFLCNNRVIIYWKKTDGSLRRMVQFHFV